MFTICGVSGSLRRGSFNTALLEAARDIAAEEARIEIADISAIPLYNGDIEAQGIPQSVVEFADAIRSADALLIATPEYNGGPPGVLKNALDWASRVKPQPLDDKPTAIMGATPGRWGTTRAQMQLRFILANVNARLVAQPMVYVAGAGKYFGDQGEGLDEATAGFLLKQIRALKALASA